MLARIRFIAALAAALPLAGCNNEEPPRNVTMTVEAGNFVSALAYTVEYVLSCEGFEKDPFLEGILPTPITC